jgi:hypothetical protein
VWTDARATIVFALLLPPQPAPLAKHSRINAERNISCILLRFYCGTWFLSHDRSRYLASASASTTLNTQQRQRGADYLVYFAPRSGLSCVFRAAERIILCISRRAHLVFKPWSLSLSCFCFSQHHSQLCHLLRDGLLQRVEPKTGLSYVMLCDTMWYCVMLCDTMWYCVMLCGAITALCVDVRGGRRKCPLARGSEYAHRRGEFD